MLVNALIITNLVFNVFFGVVCGSIACLMFKNRKVLKEQQQNKVGK